MVLIWFLLFVTVVTGAYPPVRKSEYLTWPDKYTLEATRHSLTSRIVETYKAWKSNNQSRIDYEEGSEKSIISENHGEYGAKYLIRPEVSEEGENLFKCHILLGNEYENQNVEEILPSTYEYDFEEIGSEGMNDKDAIKFYYQSVSGGSDYRRTVWAEYDLDKQVWIPLRYEIIEYSTWLGSLNKHDIWNFYNFNVDFDEKNIFEIENYECEEESAKHDMNQESVTKELVFIDPENEKHVDHVFNAFKLKYNRKYKNKREHEMRRTIFQQNMRLVASRNRQNLGYKLSINSFSDLTDKEKEKRKGLIRGPRTAGSIPFPYSESKLKDMVEDLPLEYDLRDYGLVTAVKNQEECGSCWTFGTTAAMEGALARVNGGVLMSLGNQALVDCAWEFGGAGCDGGSDNIAYNWMKKYGLPTEADYGSYKNRDGVCNIKNMTKTYRIKGFTDVTPYSVGAMKVALINHGPLTVSIDAEDALLQYSGGIFYDISCDPSKLNHEVTLVGYGQRYGDTYWIIKNSWGPQWGINGYLLISARDNNCGIATEPTYVTI